MQKTIVLIILAAILILPGCGSKKPVTTGHANTFEHPGSGSLAYYFLPRTIVTVDVEVTESIQRPGPYAAYANKYLGLPDVIMEPSLAYEITGVKVSHYVEPDPAEVYVVHIPEQDEEERDKFLMALSESGLLFSYNKVYEDGAFDKSLTKSHNIGHFGTDATFNYFIDTNLKEQIDTVIEHVMLDTISIQRETLRSSWVEKSDELRASEVAEYIMELREKKFDLISGFQEINYSKEALEYMYGEMDRMESDYLDLFTGISASDTIRYRFVHRPEKEDIAGRHTLFFFSSSRGVLPEGDTDGLPVTITYDRSKTTDAIARQISQQQEPKRPKPKGFHYRIPEYADLNVFIADERRAEARMLVNQFGIVTHLPAEDLQIEFHPQTGSIKSVGFIKEEEVE